MSRPQLAVLIPHYNDPIRLERCLDALAPQVAALPDPSVLECVLVDNNSPCDLAPLTAAHPWLRSVCETARGAAAARNRAVAETTAPHLLFLDSDCVPDASWLATGLALAGPDRVLGGRIDTFDETPPPRSGAEAFETVFAFHQRFYIEEKGFSVTANLLTTREVFDATGPMIVGISEDKDWCLRANAAGFEVIYDDSLRVTHPTRSDWAALVKKWRRLADESFALHGTSAKARASWALRAGAMALSPLPHALHVLRNKRLNGAGERGAALVTLVRLRFLRSVWMIRQAATGK